MFIRSKMISHKKFLLSLMIFGQCFFSNILASNPPLKDKGKHAHNSGRLQLCEGDCDLDSHCADGLVCFIRDDDTPVPGCSGSGTFSWDYCILPHLRDRGVHAHTFGTLQLCEGDCDTDSHCADGLKCFQRNGYTPVPGCPGEGKVDYDYCIEPPLEDKGPNAHSLPGPLQLCEGDCDSDEHCADGLKCFKRDGLTPVPGCSGSGVAYHDYCIQPPLKDEGEHAHTSGPLQLCEGDCDEDSHCTDGLRCFQRHGLTPVPGCFGSGTYDWDYCIQPPLVDKGVHAHRSGPLQLCEGDCDTDAHCADGLRCFQRNGYTPVPGCSGSGKVDYDYCIAQ